MAPTTSPRTVQLAHAGATRTRIRVSPNQRNPADLERVRRVAESQPGVTGVEVNADTGSILIHHLPGTSPADGVADALAQFGVVLKGLEEGNIGGHSESAEILESVLGELNRRVAAATDGRVDLKVLLPAGFVGLGLVRIVGDPASLFGEIPPYVLLWFGFDLYTKLRSGGKQPARGQSPAPRTASGPADASQTAVQTS